MKKYWLVLVVVTIVVLSTQCKKEEEEKPDTTPPIITLLGSNPMNVDKGTVFTDPGATAVDEKDGDISSQIKTEGSVDTAVEGTYHIKYNVSDAAGNKAVEKTREVVVMIF